MAPAALDQGRRRPDLLRPDARPGSSRPDPIRSGRDALLASLERPLGSPRDAVSGSESSAVEPRRARGAAALIGAPVATTSPFDDDLDGPQDTPAVPSLAVLRPRLKSQPDGPAGAGEKPRKRLPRSPPDPVHFLDLGQSSKPSSGFQDRGVGARYLPAWRVRTSSTRSTRTASASRRSCVTMSRVPG
jgi:hypothetical protein